MTRYFTNADHQNLIYFQMPKVLIYGSNYKTLSNEAKILYMICYDLVKLSLKNGWCDEEGNHFIKLKNQKIEELLNCKKQKAINAKKELEKHGLLINKRVGLTMANRLYILKLECTDEDIYMANDEHENIENDEELPIMTVKYENRTSVAPQQNSEKRSSLKYEKQTPEVRKSDTINNNSIKTNVNKQDIKIDDDKRTSSTEPDEEPIDLIVSHLQEQTQDDLSMRSFNSVVRKVMSKYNQGLIKKGKFRDYLVTALENKIFYLELRREKDDAKKAAGEGRKNKTQTEVHEPIPFYDWLNGE